MRFSRFATLYTFLAASSCGGEDLVLPGDARPAEMVIVRGDAQSGSVGAPLPDSIVVQVTDGEARTVTGLSVVFALGAGASGGEILPDTVKTGDNGRASALWILGDSAGQQALDARIVGAGDLGVHFTASARPAAPRAIVGIAGEDQSAPVGAALPDSLVVRVTDEFGNPVEGVDVEWQASSGSVSPRTVQTGADGRGAAQRILGPAVGNQSATASSFSLDGSPVTFTHAAMAGSPASLVMVSGDSQSAAPGAELPSPVVVRLVDRDGNGIGGRAVTWVIGSGGGSVSPNSGETDGDGLASARWSLGPSVGSYALSSVVSGVGVVAFLATATGGGGGGGGGNGGGGGGDGGGGGGGGGNPVPDHLVFQVQPSDVAKNQPIRPPVAVAVVDRNGNLVQNSGIQIRLELASGSGKLSGKRDQDTRGGVAVFDDLSLDKKGGGKVLLASVPDNPSIRSVQSATFQVQGK